MLKEIDARGRACPEPVVMTKSAVEQNPEASAYWWTTSARWKNVTRFAKNAGFAVQKSQDGPDYR